MITVGAVLAGGASRRMGRTKALIAIDGRALADRALDALRGAGIDDVALIGGDSLELAGLSATVVADRYPGDGPVGGVLTALAHFDIADRVVVLSCDLPNITPEVIGELLTPSGGDLRVAQTDRLEPLCAVWEQRCMSRVQECFDAGERALHRVITSLDAVVVPVSADAMVNVNTPADLSAVGSGVMAIEEISVADLHALGADITLIDVREDDEWADGHVAHARHVVLGTVPDHLDAFSGTPTYVMCKVGGRSLRACEFAAAQGHEVVNVTGGMLAWVEAGFETVT